MKAQAGIVYIKVDGEQLSISGDIEVPLAVENREAMIDISGNVVGYKSTYIAPYTKGTAFFTKDFPIEKLINGENMTVTTEFRSGKVYTLSGASWTGETPVNAIDGTVPFEFTGEKGIWG